MKSASQERSRRWRPFLMVALVFVLLGFSLRRPVVVAVADFVDVSEEPVPADLIFVLGGDIHTRPLAAAELYLDGYAPRIVMSRVQDSPATRMGVFPNETDAARDLMVRAGVPDSAVVVLHGRTLVASTTDEALQLRRYLQQHPADRVLLLTSNYHTRRARWNVQRKIDDLSTELTVVGVQDPRFNQGNWWRSEPGLLSYFEEYLKFVHNWLYR